MTQRDGAAKPLWYRTWWAVALITLILEGASGWVLAEEGKAVTRADLEKVASQSTVEITTTGRKSSKPHTKPVWFVYDQGHFYLQSGNEGKSDWYLNLKKNPQLSLKIGALSFSGKAKFVEDAKETERIYGLFSSKYLLARAAGAVGSSIGHGKPIEVELQ
jgi:deazaflavin-dependent oxidoreductase (nitroreductase family)